MLNKLVFEIKISPFFADCGKWGFRKIGLALHQKQLQRMMTHYLGTWFMKSDRLKERIWV